MIGEKRQNEKNGAGSANRQLTPKKIIPQNYGFCGKRRGPFRLAITWPRSAPSPAPPTHPHWFGPGRPTFVRFARPATPHRNSPAGWPCRSRAQTQTCPARPAAKMPHKKAPPQRLLRGRFRLSPAGAGSPGAYSFVRRLVEHCTRERKQQRGLYSAG